MTRSKIRTIAFVGDYLPRLCGIATFTTDLCRSMAAQFPQTRCFAVPVNDVAGGYDYPPEVRFEIEEQDLASYKRAADFLGVGGVDVVCVQHEFGIYGGAAGGHLLALLREVDLPIVTTLHTILRKPDADQERVMRELIHLSTRLVVMSKKGGEFLRDVFQAPAAKIDLIPHGIPETPRADSGACKRLFGVAGKQVLLTFGLISPNKGIEHMLNALPAITAEHPGVVYVILGATHPNLVREQGESYRLGLELLAEKNGVQKNVIFYNRFVDLPELKAFIGAADIYVTPYLNEAQITSGTLAYCFGAGKPVVSTPYWYAQELLADGRGVLVPFNDPGAIARAVTALLGNDARREALSRDAYRLGREMVWGSVARSYMKAFESARAQRAGLTRKLFTVKTLDQQLADLPGIKLDHLYRMTDSTGLFQHAIVAVPNFSTGYCTDDNARALALAVLLEELKEDSPRLLGAATTYAAFVRHAFDPESRRFRNFMNFDRSWKDETPSEDCCGRALAALGTCVGRSKNAGLQALARQIFAHALAPATEFKSPRAWALALIGVHEYLRRLHGDRQVSRVRDALTDLLLGLYARTATPDWPWFEDSVTYMNAGLPHALILSGAAASRADALELGLKTLRWLTKIQTAAGGYLRPIGSNGFYQRGGARAEFDQQPIEAQAMVSACLEAYRRTSDDYWFGQARRAFDWFLGRNDLGLFLYDPNTGGCRDGLHVDRVNQNQGAESTLAFLVSLAEMKRAHDERAAFKAPPA
ncbi:MAG: glycosyltransferase family 4 protein [Elusimicrobia bacterium]|nr:glycosyltransferase family 4 protein [Elusimicrobiota bacterium]